MPSPPSSKRGNWRKAQHERAPWQQAPPPGN
jgi:hypothetical protein